MTVSELYSHAKELFKSNGIEDFGFEAVVLCEHFFGYNRADIISKGSFSPDESLEQSFLSAVQKRLKGYPLQYIIGKWGFMSLELEIGEGVLIPRDDTEVTIRCAAELLKNKQNAVGVDLCAGSGAVALGLLSLKPDLKITAAELSSKASTFLEKNVENFGEGKIEIFLADITDKSFADRFSNLDFIVSNPPYIESAEIRTLQKEVLSEPFMALDGGDDGLYFYRKIAELWVAKLSKGGIISVEIGDTQGAEVENIFIGAGLSDVKVHRDLSGLQRCVTGIK